jgi:hypothetical protein
VGKCCGASKSEKRAGRSRARQRDLEEIAVTLDDVLRPIPQPEPIVLPREPVQMRPTATDRVPGWKRNQQERIADRYGEMVFEKDDAGVGGVKMHGGKVPGVQEDESARGQPFRDFSEEDKAMVAMAQGVLTRVRADLPRGAFNNYVGLPADVQRRQNKPGTDTHAPGWWNSVVDIAAGIAAGQLAPSMPEVNAHKLQLACLARASKAVGGGVCSKMATMTAGALTTAMPPGSEIVQVFSGVDHEFVIARAPGSRWFVVDPWPESPLTVPFVDCDFGPDTIQKFIAINVTERAPENRPFGIDVETGVDWRAVVEAAKTQVSDDQPLTLGHEFRQPSNVDNLDGFAPELRSIGRRNWG